MINSKQAERKTAYNIGLAKNRPTEVIELLKFFLSLVSAEC